MKMPGVEVSGEERTLTGLRVYLKPEVTSCCDPTRSTNTLTPVDEHVDLGPVLEANASTLEPNAVLEQPLEAEEHARAREILGLITPVGGVVPAAWGSPVLDDEQREIIRHSLGLNRSEVEYRNAYCIADGDPALERLVTLGCMARGRLINEGRDRYYHVTDLGRMVTTGYAVVSTTMAPKPTVTGHKVYVSHPGSDWAFPLEGGAPVRAADIGVTRAATLEDGTPRTRVVNVRYEEFDVYVGRKGRGYDGYFGNPYHARGSRTRHDAIALFRTYFDKRIASDPDFKGRVEALRGKRLACFCAPLACHADVYREYLDGAPKFSQYSYKVSEMFGEDSRKVSAGT